MAVKQADEEAVAQDMAVLGEEVVLRERRHDHRHQVICNIIFIYIYICSLQVPIYIFFIIFTYYYLYPVTIITLSTRVFIFSLFSYSFSLYFIASYFIIHIYVAMKWKGKFRVLNIVEIPVDDWIKLVFFYDYPTLDVNCVVVCKYWCIYASDLWWIRWVILLYTDNDRLWLHTPHVPGLHLPLIISRESRYTRRFKSTE